MDCRTESRLRGRRPLTGGSQKLFQSGFHQNPLGPPSRLPTGFQRTVQLGADLDRKGSNLAGLTFALRLVRPFAHKQQGIAVPVLCPDYSSFSMTCLDKSWECRYHSSGWDL
jgi:hypothetical protein